MQVSCLSAFQLPWHCLVAPHVSQEASGFQYLSASLQDLIRRMLTLDPAERITTDAIASHPWLAAINAAIPPPAVTVGADGAEAAARDWSTFWPDAESLTASAGAAGAGVGLPTIGSLGSDESYDMGAYHARLSRELQRVIRAGLAGFLLALSVAGAALGLHVFSGAGSPVLAGSPRSFESGVLDLLPAMVSLDSGSGGLPLQLSLGSTAEMDERD